MKITKNLMLLASCLLALNIFATNVDEKDDKKNCCFTTWMKPYVQITGGNTQTLQPVLPIGNHIIFTKQQPECSFFELLPDGGIRFLCDGSYSAHYNLFSELSRALIVTYDYLFVYAAFVDADSNILYPSLTSFGYANSAGQIFTLTGNVLLENVSAGYTLYLNAAVEPGPLLPPADYPVVYPDFSNIIIEKLP